MQTNAAKRQMLEGEPAIGAAASLGSPLSAEILSLAGYDFVLVDNQHGSWSFDSSTLAFHSIGLGDAVPMARVQQNDFFAIGGLLDRGAVGLVVPMVHTRQHAQQAVFAARFPPLGGRSQGPFGVGFLRRSDYVEWIEKELFLAVQIESQEAVDNAEDILSVEGIDGCWIGPADLANSMRVDRSTPSGRQKHEKAIMRVLEACHKVGKIPGIAGGVEARRWLEKGFLFVTTVGDANFVAQGGEAELEDLRKLVSQLR